MSTGDGQLPIDLSKVPLHRLGRGVTSVSFSFGTGNASYPVVGDWDADGIDTVGVKQTAGATWSLRNSNSAGAADQTILFGQANALPLTWRKP